jgi:hypothetical protein
MSTTIASNSILTNSVELINTTSSDLVIGSTISATNSVRIGKSAGGGVPVTFPSYVTTDRINPVSSTGRMLIGTVNGADQVSPFQPSITIGRVGQTVRIGGGTSTGGKLQVNNIDTINTADELKIGDTNAGSVVICNNLLVNSNAMSASTITLINDGTNSMITINDDPYPLYIAPSTTIKPEAVCTALNLGNTAIPVTIEGTTIGIGNGGATPSTTTLNGLLSVSNGTGTAGMSLTSGGASGVLSWEERAVIQSGQTAVGAMTSAVTGDIFYGFSYAVPPYIQLTMNLNGTGTTIIPVAVSAHIIDVGGQYEGFTWIVGTTSATATISWYVTL